MGVASHRDPPEDTYESVDENLIDEVLPRAAVAWRNIIELVDEVVQGGVCSLRVGHGASSRHEAVMPVRNNWREEIERRAHPGSEVSVSLGVGNDVRQLEALVEDCGRLLTHYVVVDDLEFGREGGRGEHGGRATGGVGTSRSVRPSLQRGQGCGLRPGVAV